MTAAVRDMSAQELLRGLADWLDANPSEDQINCTIVSGAIGGVIGVNSNVNTLESIAFLDLGKMIMNRTVLGDSANNMTEEDYF